MPEDGLPCGREGTTKKGKALHTGVVRGQTWTLCMVKDPPSIDCTHGKKKSGCLQAVGLLPSTLPYLCTASPTAAHTPLAMAKEQPLTLLSHLHVVSSFCVCSMLVIHRPLSGTRAWVFSTAPRVTPVSCTSSLSVVGR